jgi:osmotically-inducible protein OsmY
MKRSLFTPAMAVAFSVAHLAMAQAPKPPDVGQSTAPATAIDRQENNPAKAAVDARKAQKKDEASGRISADGLTTRSQDVDRATRAVREASEALRKDARTAKLGVQVSIGDDGSVVLHGSVPSQQSRAAAESVVSQVVGTRRIQNDLVVTTR